MEPESPSSNYWLYQWIDEEEIRHAKDLRKALRSEVAVDRLLELEEDRSVPTLDKDSSHRAAVVAGRRVDLSGFLGCANFECVLPQIDALFGKTWHYFDTIVVDDPELHDPAEERFDDDIEQRVNLLLHLRKIGASENIAFQRKACGFCTLHFREFAEDNALGLDFLFDEANENSVVEQLVDGARFEIERRDDHWHYKISHPKLEPIIGTYSHGDRDTRPTREEAAREAWGRYCSGVISDVAASRELGMPLLQVAEGTHSFGIPEVADSAHVALNLRLPVLANVSAKEILRLKHDNWAEFERFRFALRAAIKEQSDREGSASPEDIAQAVVEEFITPELAAIEVKLDASKRALRKKMGANVTVAASTLSIGTLAHVPLVFGASLLAASWVGVKNTLPDYKQSVDARAEIETSDLYFLWRARLKHNDSWRHH